MNGRTAAFLALTVTVLVIALTTGTLVYWLMAAMMGMMAIIGLVSALLTTLTLRVSLTGQRKRAVRGDSVTVRVHVQRRTLLPPGLLELTLVTPEGESAQRTMTAAAPIKGREYRFNMRCTHRGVVEMGVTRIAIADIFGLFHFSRKIKDCVARVEVSPRLIYLSPMMIPPGDQGPQSRVRMTEDLASPAGVRDWQEGDSLKKVHWKLTARRRELMVRTFEESARPDFLILMDCAPVNAFSSHVRTIEDALCEQAAAAALKQMEAGYPVRMPLNAAQPRELAGQSPGEIGHFLNALTYLRFDSPHSFEQVITLEMRRLQRTGALILITTRLNPTLSELAFRVHQLGVAVEYIWVCETATPDQVELQKRLALMDVAVEQVNPWQEN